MLANRSSPKRPSADGKWRALKTPRLKTHPTGINNNFILLFCLFLFPFSSVRLCVSCSGTVCRSRFLSVSVFNVSAFNKLRHFDWICRKKIKQKTKRRLILPVYVLSLRAPHYAESVCSFIEQYQITFFVSLLFEWNKKSFAWSLLIVYHFHIQLFESFYQR